ncbi:MAG: TIGR02996 domain-containing protein, partial [Polyangiales bacterium]
MDLEAAHRRIVERRAARAHCDLRGEYSIKSFIEAQQLAGWAAHRLMGAFVVDLANRSLKHATDEIVGADWQKVRGSCIEAVFDGYELGSIVSGVIAKHQGESFTRAATAGAFVSRVTQSGEAVLSGRLGELAHRLCDHWALELPAELTIVGKRAIANALAAGMLLHAKEHGVTHPVFTELEKAAVKKRPPRDEAPAKKAQPSPEQIDAILASPDDDEVRLVYGDWLAEQGDPLGEFIQIQCALGRALIGAGGKYASREGRKLPFDSRQELESREKELLKKHEREWLAPIRPFIRQWQFRRGFVDHVIADVGAFLDGLEPLCRVPLASAQITGFKSAHVAKFASARSHPSLFDLDFSRNRVDARTAEVLGSALFSRVRVLNLWRNPLGDAGLARLSKYELAGIRTLTLSRVDATSKGVLALSEAPFWSRLRHLDLSSNEGLDETCLPAFERATALETI